MPTLKATRDYALYVIGYVESRHNWGAVNMVDAITVGITQWYGLRARDLILRCKAADPTGWAAFAASAPDLAAAVQETHSWDWWTNWFLTDKQAEAWNTWANRTENQQVQIAQWSDDFSSYMEAFSDYGYGLSSPKNLIYAMSMYHQQPRACFRVMQSVSASATLASLHSVCLNDTTFSVYKNRYNDVYRLLNAWDGESEPPAFGDWEEIPDSELSGNPSGVTQQSNGIQRVEMRGGNILVWGVDGYPDGLYCVKSGPNIWIPITSKGGTTITGGTTGGGTETGTTAQQELADNMRSWVGKFAYGQGPGRTDPMNSGYADCSSIIWYDYHIVTGQNIGYNTFQQFTNGTLVASGHYGTWDKQATLQLGDVLLIKWNAGGNPNDQHACMFVGNGQLASHGGGQGPKLVDLDSYLGNCPYWEFRRYVT